MAKDEKGPLSPNAKALAKLAEKMTFAGIGKRLGCAGPTVRHWSTAYRTPDAEMKLKMREEFGLDTMLWEARFAPLPPVPNSQDHTVGGVQVIPEHEGVLRILPEDHVHNASEPLSLVETYREMDRTLSRQLDAAGRDKTVNVRDLSGLTQARLKVLSLIGRMTGESDITEAQVLKSQAFAVVLDALRDVCRQFPDAGRAFAEALQKIAEPKTSTKGKKE